MGVYLLLAKNLALKNLKYQLDKAEGRSESVWVWDKSDRLSLVTAAVADLSRFQFAEAVIKGN